MIKNFILVSAALTLPISSPAAAGSKIVVQPVQIASESIRYNHGVATIDQFSDTGSVQVRPGQLDHGSLTFNIAVFNNGRQSSNIDVSNFHLTSEGVTVAAMTVDTLERKAKNRAAWTQIGLAALGGLSAAAAASQRDTYHGTLVTPYGRTYHSYYSAPSAYGQLQATAAIAATGVGIAAVQNRLDKTLEALGNQIVQMTTIDPDDSYAGTIIFEKVKLSKLPMQVTMTVDWNGRQYPFTFQIAKPGTPAPPFTPAPISEPLPVEPAPAPAPAMTPQPMPAVIPAVGPPASLPPRPVATTTRTFAPSPEKPKARPMVDHSLEINVQ
ncbi:hypothetical protein [Sphingobium yanoikuyae]|uniref:hypothetical protein n=1 Tax=Sphingobium yanoikuyae TaxID=13690 RepID=UPI002FDE53E3